MTNSRSCEITRQVVFQKKKLHRHRLSIRGVRASYSASLTEVNSSVETATIGSNALVKSVKVQWSCYCFLNYACSIRTTRIIATCSVAICSNNSIGSNGLLRGSSNASVLLVYSLIRYGFDSNVWKRGASKTN